MLKPILMSDAESFNRFPPSWEQAVISYAKWQLSKTVTPFFSPSEQQASQIMKQRLYPNKSLA
jgi:hypothetical protein